MNQSDAWRMIRRRGAAAGIAAPIGCHTFRATGITAYLANGVYSATFLRTAAAFAPQSYMAIAPPSTWISDPVM
jgi:integrase